MAPERTGQSTIPDTHIIIKEDLVLEEPRKKTTSILEDFLEIKIKEELDYPGVRRRRRDEDQDLTSLSWLQSNNLLKSKPLKLHESSVAAAAAAKKIKADHQQHPQLITVYEESPTSDLTEESLSECSSTNHSVHSSSRVVLINSSSANNIGGGVGGLVSVGGSPLIMDGPSVSFEEVPQTHTEPIIKYFTSSESHSPTGASLVPSSGSPRPFINNKEKHLYSVPYDPQLHVNSKPPYSFSCLIFMAIEDSHARALPVKEIYSWITDHFPYFNKAPTGWKNSVRHNLSLNKCFRKVDKAPNLGKGSLWIVDPQYRPNLLNALAKAPYHPCASLDRPAKAPILPSLSLTPQQADLMQVKSQSRLPNPELFPYLSKRLAASEVDRMEETDEGSDVDSLDDVDAAAAMLELKHGQPRPKMWRKKARVEDELIISTSPSEDHTYTSFSMSSVAASASTPNVVVSMTGASAAGSGGSSLRYSTPTSTHTQTRRKMAGAAGAHVHAQPPLSPDEAYGGDTDDELSPFPDENEESWSSDGAEQRNVASALLNLAGGTRKRGPAILNRSRGKRNMRGQRGSRRGAMASLRGRRPGEALNNNSEKLTSGRSKQHESPVYR